MLTEKTDTRREIENSNKGGGGGGAFKSYIDRLKVFQIIHLTFVLSLDSCISFVSSL